MEQIEINILKRRSNQWHRKAWGTGARAALEFANARKFCRPNARLLSLLDDFGTRAARASAPWSKILATPMGQIEFNFKVTRSAYRSLRLLCRRHL